MQDLHCAKLGRRPIYGATATLTLWLLIRFNLKLVCRSAARQQCRNTSILENDQAQQQHRGESQTEKSSYKKRN
jgi:hypothetical protein